MMMEAREYSKEELEELHKEQLQAMVPLVLEVWAEMQIEEKGGNESDAEHESEVRRVG